MSFVSVREQSIADSCFSFYEQQTWMKEVQTMPRGKHGESHFAFSISSVTLDMEMP